MAYDPNKHHRRSIRLRGYDYASPGCYFVTICTHERAALFDDPALRQIAEEQWGALNDAGLRGAHAGRVSVDAWVVMPNHVHAIIVIADPADHADHVDPADDVNPVGARQPESIVPVDAFAAAAPLLPDVGVNVVPGSVGTPSTSGASPPGVGVNGVPGSVGTPSPPGASPPGVGVNVAPGSLGAIVRSYKAAVARRINRRRRTPGAPVWQRGYYERIIRGERALNNVRRYIAANPARWAAGRDRLDALLARMEQRA